MKEKLRGTSVCRKIRHEYKRILAFMLSFMMFFTNVGNNVSVALAANAVPTASATFHLNGEDIREAAQEAIEGGGIFDLASLEMNTKDATLMSKYERLLSDGYVYEIYPNMDDEGIPEGAELRTFIRVDNMEEEDYQITGNEEMIFLFVNSSEQRIQFYADVDGYITSRVTVDGHTSGVQNQPAVTTPVEESKPAVEETTEETVPEETIAVPNSSETESTEASLEESTEAAESETSVENSESAAEPETTEASEPETEPETAEASEPETEPETTEAAEPETERETEEVTEPETTKAEEKEVTLSKSRNVVSIVAAPEGEEVDAEVEAEPETEAEAEAEPETEAETEPETKETKEETAAEIESETQVTKSETVETEESAEAKPEESSETNETAESVEANGQETTESITETVQPEKETTAAPAKDPDEYIIEEDKDYYDGIELIDDVTPIDEKLDDENHGGSISGTTYNQIELGEEAYARAFKTTLNALHIDAEIEGYSISYMIDPMGSADIINKKSSVLEGESIRFGVRPQIGYEIEEVTANGVSLEEAEEASESNASGILYYTVDGVTEDVDIEVTLSEVGEHPGLNESVTVKGVTITATALPGIIPEGTKLDVKEVTTQLEEAVKEKIESETQGEKEVTSVLAYDINLIHNGKKLENDWAGDDNFVKISFSGNKIEENSKEAETIEVLHADTEAPEPLEAVTAASVTAADLVLDDEGRQAVDVAGENSVDEVDFDATHFSIYVIVGSTDSKQTQNDVATLQLGSTKKLYCDTTDGSNYSWITSDSNIAKVSKGSDGYSATVTASSKKTGTARITCSYKTASGSNKSEIFTVTVVNGDTKYKGYFYIRKPGTENNETINYTNAWYYVDTVENAITGVNRPSASKQKYTDLTKIVKYPSSYPTIQYDGNGDGKPENYTYATTGATGTYSVDWGYIIDSSGANNGNTTITSAACYHVDGFATLYIDNKVNVNFKAKHPGSDSFGLVLNYPKEIGTEYRYLLQPTYGSGEGQIQQNISYNWEDYEFDGWYADEACTQKVTFSNNKTKLNDDTTFYGHYVTKARATITYKVSPEGSGTLTSYSETLAPINGVAKGSTATANDNYVFKGWFDSNGKKVSDNLSYTPAQSGGQWKNATYTAVFEEKTGILRYNLNPKGKSNATWNIPTGFTTVTAGREYQDGLKYLNGETVEIPGQIPQSKGYEFVKWNGNQAGTSEINALAGKNLTYPSGNLLTLYAVWNPVTYTINYVTNGGTNSSKNPGSYTIESQNITFEPAERDGYIFEGWYTDNTTFRDEKTGIAAGSIGNVTVYAKWTADTSKLAVSGVEKVYDGIASSVTVTGALESDTIEYKGPNASWSSTNPSYTNVGTYNVDVRVTRNGTAIWSDKAQVSITARPITITVDPSEKFFGEKDPTFTGDFNAESLVNKNDLGEVIYVRDNAGVETVGTYTGVLNVSYTANSNYLVTVNLGTFTIKTATDAKAKLIGAGGSWTYDGKEHSASANVTGAKGYTIEYKVGNGEWTTEPPAVTDVKDGIVTVSFRATKEGYYPLEAEDKTIAITPKDVAIKVNDSRKVYGTDDPSFSGTVNGLVENDPVGIGTVSYERKNKDQDVNVGTYKGVLDATYTKNPNYNVTVTPADFTITKAADSAAELEIVGGSQVYNGKAFKVQMSTLDKIKYALQNYTIWYTTDNGATWSKDVPSVTNVEEGTVTVQAKGTRANYEDILSNEVTISITERPVTITVQDDSKAFNSDDPTFKWSVTSKNKLVNSSDLGEITGYRIQLPERDNEEVGTYPQVLSVNYTDNRNYLVTVEKGNFEITKAKDENAKLNVSGGSWTYDGKDHGVSAEVTGAEGYTIYYKTGEGDWTTTIPTVKNVEDGEKQVAVKAVKTGYEDLIGSTSIQITAKKVTITVHDAWKYFDAADPMFTGEMPEGSLINADDLGTIEYVRTNQDQAVKLYEDVLSAEYKKNLNYDVTVVLGDFEIRTASIKGAVLSAEGGSWIYDGNAHKASAAVSGAEGYTVYYKTGKGDWTTVAPEVTNVSEGTKTVSVKAVRTGYEDLTAEDVDIRITERPVTIKVNDASKFYNENDPEFSGYVLETTEDQGLIKAEDLVDITYYRINADVGAVGKYPDMLSAHYTPNTNYTVTIEPGDFEIITATDKNAKLTLEGGSWPYDGKTHEAKADVIGADGFTIYYQVDGGEWTTKVPSVTNVVDGEKIIAVKAVKTGYTDLTAEEPKTIKITARPITITVDNKEKDFGEDDPTFTGGITSGTLVNSNDLGPIEYRRDDITVEAVGIYPDFINAAYIANDNYNVTVRKGTFTINTATDTKAKLIGTGGSWTYDGKEHSASANVTGANGYTIEYKVGDGEWTTKQPAVTDVKDGIVTVSFRATKEGYYPLEAEDKTIAITPKDVAIKVNDSRKVYGTDDPSFSGTVKGLVENDPVGIGTVSYERKNKDQDVNVGTYKGVLDATYTKNPNYDVTVTPADFTITKAADSAAELEIVGGSQVYNGNAFKVHMSTLDKIKYALQNYTIWYTTDNGATWSKDVPSVTNVEEGTITVQAKGTRANYEDILSNEVTISITERPVTIKVQDDSKAFNSDDPKFKWSVTSEYKLVNSSDLGEITGYRIQLPERDNEEVGTYPQVLSVNYTDNRNYLVTVEKGNFEITKAKDENAKLNVSGGSWTYDGKDHGVSAEVAGAEGYTIYYKTGEGDWSTTIPTVKNVEDGEKQVAVKAVKTGYEDLIGSTSIQITAKKVTITVHNAWKYFDADDPTFTGEMPEGSLINADDLGTIKYVRTNQDQAVKLYEDVLSAEYKKNLNYDVTVVLGDFEILTASIEGAVLSAEGGSWIYDGNAHKASAAVSGAEGYTVYYKTGKGDWTTVAPEVTNVSEGTKTVSVKASRTGYKDLTAEDVDIRITKRPVTIKVNEAYKFYNENDPKFSGHVLEATEDQGLIRSDDLGTITYYRTNKDEKVGLYPDALSARYKENTNYDVMIYPGDFVIMTATDADAELTLKGGSWIYDGDNHKAEAEVTGATGYTIYYQVDGGEWTTEVPGVTNVDDGIKAISVKAIKEGYTDLTADGVTLQVTARPIIITVKHGEKFFNEEDPEFNGGISSGELVGKNDLGTITFVRDNKDIDTSVGTYEQVLNAEYTQNNNYDVTVVKGNFQIKTASSQGVTLDAKGGSWVYDGKAHGVTAEVTGAEGYTISYKVGEGDWTTEAPSVTTVSEGRKTVAVKAEKTGYEDVNAEVTIEITPMEIIIKVDNSEKFFDEKDPDFTGRIIEGSLADANDLETIEYVRINGEEAVGVYPGVLSASYTDNTNYLVTVQKGNFEIKTATVEGAVLTAAGGSWIYDGTAHEATAEVTGAEDYTISYKVGDGDWTTNAPSVTEVSEGTKVVSVKATRPGYAELNTENVEISIMARPITIKVNDAWKYFDASDPDFTGSIVVDETHKGLVNDGDLGTISYYRNSDESAVGIYEKVLTAGFESNANYSVTVLKGNFEIRTATDANAELTLEGGSWIYDGKAHEAKAEVTGAEGYTIYYRVGNGSWTTEVPKVTNVIDGIKSVSVKAVKDGYTDLTADPETIQVTERELTITVNDGFKFYDEDDPIFTGDFDESKLVNKDDLKTVVYVRDNKGVEDVGTYNDVLNVAYTANSNYRVTVIKGDFIIQTATDKNAKLTLEGGSWIYDGESHEAKAKVTGADGYTIQYQVDGGEWTTEVPNVTDVNDGVKTIAVKAVKTGYTDLTADPETIKVTARPITITVEPGEKFFNEEDPEFNGGISSGELVGKNDLGTITFVRDNKDIDTSVGTYEQVLNAEYTQNNNYDVTVVKGNFQIKTASSQGVTLDAKGGSWVYDGKAHGVTAEVTGAEGYTISYKVGEGDWTTEAPSVTTVSEGRKTVSVKAEKAGYEDVNAEVTIEITPMEIIIKVDNSEKFFDEKDPDFTGRIIKGSLADANDLETIKYVRMNGEEAVGVYPGVLTASYTDNTNYLVTVQKGNFEIKTATVEGAVLTAAGGSWIYDGTAHEATAEVTGAEGYTISYKVGDGDWTTNAPSVTEVSEGTKVVSVKATRPGYTELNTENVEISITARPITIQVNDAWKYFDASDPDFTGFIVVDETHKGLVNDGDLGTISYYRNSDESTVGIYEKVLTAEFESNANYDVTVVNGNFEIRTATDESAVLDAEGGSWTYDGNAHKAKAEVSGAEGYTIYYKVGNEDWTTEAPSVTDVNDGTKTVSVKAVKTGYTDLLTTDVEIQVIPKGVTITVDSYTKDYGSQDPIFSGSVTGLVNTGDLGEITYQRVEPGKENVGDDIPLTAVFIGNSNYTVEVIPGKLNIIASTENAVNVGSQTVTYDGTAYGLKTAEALRDGSTLLYSTDNQNFSSSAPVFTEAGTHTVYVKATNPNYVETAVVTGTVVINKRPLTITAGSASKRYDGSAVTNTSAEITSGSLAEGQQLVDVNVTGSQTTVGTSDNVASDAVIMANGEDVTGNYEIAYVNGTLTITSRGGSSSGGGGGSSTTTPGYGNGGDTGNGPGSTTINPTDVPLASMPNDITTGENILIDDGEVPLAALPKTGNQVGMNAVLAMLSGMLLAAYLTISKKKDEES
ncbi:hypothetical protein C0033_20140 [Clostridium sp. chh4-2]|uniref:doubled motif LPXTG anchor domain-containing protein n=1 Tax=Clostridium sp. chh4-2 TaxID=2067550 RepID=UPI000CCF0C36|nr:doubled motif LPXTG anchor domain-containing protein [Clostridium sp. chh4-2]PNV60155.1 hypothetical protein C0033_20140 [Clostridium sp. chh4-2]